MLLCVMLVASVTAFAWFVRGQISSVSQEREMLQARSIAQLMTQEAMRGLRLDYNDYDSPNENWFQPMFLPLRDYGLAKVLLIPLDDKIPLSKLFLPDGVTLRNELKEVWERIWENLGRRDLAPKVLDFIDKDKKPRLGGHDSEDNINREIADISELLGMKDITPELLYGDGTKLGLADYVTMWSGTKININTAPAHVLALLDGLNERLAAEIVEYRMSNEIQALDDLKEIAGFPAQAMPVLMNIIGFTSSYFLLKLELVAEGGVSEKYFDIVVDKSTGRVVRWEEK